MSAADDRGMLDELAERLGLEDDEREQFISSSMKRMGYKPRVDWDDPDPEDGKGGGGGDFFSRRQQRQSRDVSRGSGRGRSDDRRSAGGYDY